MCNLAPGLVFGVFGVADSESGVEFFQRGLCDPVLAPRRQSGDGVFPVPTIDLAQNAHDYGAVRLNAQTRWFLDISNQGNQVLTIDDITIDAEGDLDARRLFGIDEGVRAGFSDVRLAITITGPESQERYEHLREAVDAHCPVLDLFANATPVTATVRKG